MIYKYTYGIYKSSFAYLEDISHNLTQALRQFTDSSVNITIGVCVAKLSFQCSAWQLARALELAGTAVKRCLGSDAYLERISLIAIREENQKDEPEP